MKKTGLFAKRGLSLFNAFSIIMTGAFLVPLAVDRTPAVGNTPEVDKHLQLPDTSDAGTGTGLNDGLTANGQVIPAESFTAEVWVHPDSLDNASVWHQIIQQGGNDPSNYDRFGLNLYTATGSSQNGYSGLELIVDGINVNLQNQRIYADQWTHIAVAVDKKSDTNLGIEIFINGVSVYSQDNTPNVTFGVRPDNFTVGYFPEEFDKSDRHFHGGIDQLKIWNGALTETQVKQSMHNHGASGVSSAPTLRAHLDFNNGFTDFTENYTFNTVGTVSRENLVTPSTVGGDTVITFPRSYLTSTGGWTPTSSGPWEALLVAGGGAGGVRHGGGGGAGELLYTSNITLSGATTIRVGQGGVARLTETSQSGAKGQPTVLGSYQVAGGGGGVSANGDEDASGQAGNSVGGSNGGGSADQTLATQTSAKETGPNSEKGIGNIGGSAHTSGLFTGGGGGGAGSPGEAGADDNAGDGGAGYAMKISGTTTCYAAGGGGGANTGETPGAGGSCPGVGTSGGAGVAGSGTSAGSGEANTGSGGGGGGFDNAGDTNSVPGSGGSGVIVLRTAPSASVSLDASTTPNTNVGLTVSLNARAPRTGYGYQVTMEATGGGSFTMGNAGQTAVTDDSDTDYPFGFDDITDVSIIRLSGQLDTISTALNDTTFNIKNSTSNNTIDISIDEVPINDDIYFNDGRFYEYVEQALAHPTGGNGTTLELPARAAAKERFVFNQQGYLTNITTAEENRFLAEKFDAENLWIGISDNATEDEWRFLDGPEAEAGDLFFTENAGSCQDPKDTSINPSGCYSSDYVIDGAVAWNVYEAGTTRDGETNPDGPWAINEPNGTADYAITNFLAGGAWDDFDSQANGYIVEYGVNSTNRGREFVRLQTSAQTTATLVISAPSTTNPSAVETTDGTVNFSVTGTANSGGSLSYQWERKRNGSWASIGASTDSDVGLSYSNETTNTLSISDIDLSADGFEYRAVVTETVGSASEQVISSEAVLTVSTSFAANEDIYLRRGSIDSPPVNDDSSYGQGSALYLKTVAGDQNSSYNRVAYLKFNFNDSLTWDSAALELTVNFQDAGGTDTTDYGDLNAFLVSVYGRDDITDPWPGEGPASNTDAGALDWDDGPHLSFDSSADRYQFDGSEYLGDFQVKTKDGGDGITSGGQKNIMSNEKLKDFLNNSDGEVYLFLVRTDGDPLANLSFASRENTTFDPPTLRFQSNTDEYLVTYSLNGGSGNIPDNQTFDGTNPITLDDGSGLTGPGGGAITSWNTEAGGGGDSFTLGQTYNTRQSLSLYAQYKTVVTPTLSYPASIVYSPEGTVNDTTTTNDHTGTVSYSSSDTDVCTVDSSGTLTTVSAGTCTITASFAEDSTYAAATATHDVTISTANQSGFDWDSGLSSSVNFGDTLTLLTTGGNGNGAITYLPSGGGCTVSGDTLIPGNAGESCSVIATKAADNNYNAANTSSKTFTINRIAQPASLTLTSSNTLVVTETLELTGFGGNGDGSLSFVVSDPGTAGCSLANGNELSATSAGDCDVTVTRAQGTNYLVKISSAQTITVSKADQSISFISTVPAEPVALDTYTPTATASSGLAVSFSIASASSSVCSISAGVVTFNTQGSCVLEANQAGNAGVYNAANTVSQTIAVGSKNQNISFGSLSDKTFGSAAFQVSATASSGLSVVFSKDSSTTNSACTVSTSGLITLGDVGTCVVKASQAGDSTWSAANDVLQSFEVLADTAGKPFIGSISFSDRSLTASFFKPTYLGGGTLSGYELRAFTTTVDGEGNTVADQLAATNSSCSASGSQNESCTINGLTNGVEYVLRVAAITQAGLGNLSDISQPRTPASNPSAPQNLIAVQGDTTLDLSWQQPISLGGGSFVKYLLYWRESGGSYQAFNDENHSISNIATTSYQITGLDNGTSYDVKILVTTGVNNAELVSNTAEVVQTPYTVPNAPGDVVVIEDGNRVVVSWTVPDFDGGNEVDGYDVKIDESVECTLVTANSCEITKPSPGSSVTISVEAKNDAGASQPGTVSYSVASLPPSGGGGFINETPERGGPDSGKGPVITPPDFEANSGFRPGEDILLEADNPGNVSAALAGEYQIEIVGITRSNMKFRLPKDIPAGTYDLILIIDGQRAVYEDFFVIASVSSTEAVSAWTKKISDTEVKVYIKNPEYGRKYRMLHQTGGSGSYGSILAHTPLDSEDPKLRFAIGSYYFVRTFDLEPGTNRIRISVDGKDVELRGLNRPVRYDR
jgi:hypothetical protein